MRKTTHTTMGIPSNAVMAAVWGGFLDGPLSVMNNVVWDLLDNGTQYIDTIAYSAYYASAGAVI